MSQGSEDRKSGGQEIAVRKSTDLAQVEELEAILLGEKGVPEVADDPAEIQKEIMAQLLAATTDEELEQVGNAQGWRELVGVPILIEGFRWRPSSYDEGSPVFFVVTGTRLDTGERVALTTGSGNVLAQLTNMAKRGTLTGSIRMVEVADKQTKSGFLPYWLRTPPQPMLEEIKAKAAEAAEEGAVA
jgi:hypothetical protein